MRIAKALGQIILFLVALVAVLGYVLIQLSVSLNKEGDSATQGVTAHRR